MKESGFMLYTERKKKEPGIAFRSEIDAVPVKETTDLAYKSLTEGMSHTCGHDGHCAALLATALHIERTGAIVMFIFFFNMQKKLVQVLKNV